MHIVNNGAMPDVCVQHLVAMSIVDGTVTFASVHDHDRMGDPAVQAVRKNVELVGSSGADGGEAGAAGRSSRSSSTTAARCAITPSRCAARPTIR